MRPLLLILLSLGLVACGSPQALTPAPTPSSVFISYPAYLEPERNLITTCAGQISAISVFTIPDRSAQPDTPGILLKLQLGSESIHETQAYQIGQLELKIIVNTANPLVSLSPEELWAIYTGQQEYWEHNATYPIQVWSYPRGDVLRAMLEAALPDKPRLTQSANIAPNPQAILESIAADPYGIGYLPASWLPDSSTDNSNRVKPLSLEPPFQADLTQPVIVTVPEMLTYLTEALLVCVQQAGD